MTKLDQNLNEIFDRLAGGGGVYTPEEMVADYDNHATLAGDLAEIYGGFANVADDLPVQFESWADVAEALLEWAKKRYAN